MIVKGEELEANRAAKYDFQMDAYNIDTKIKGK